MSYHYKLVFEVLDEEVFDAIDDLAISIDHLQDGIEKLSIADDNFFSVDSAHAQKIRSDLASIMDETVEAKHAVIDMLLEVLKANKDYLGEVVSVKEAGEFYA